MTKLARPKPLNFRKSLREIGAAFIQIKTNSIVDVHRRADRRHIINPLGIFSTEIDASMTHRGAKVVVPIGSVDSIAAKKIHHVRHTRQIIPRSCHIRGYIFDIDLILPGHRRRAPGAGRDYEAIQKVFTLINLEILVSQVDIDPDFALFDTGW